MRIYRVAQALCAWAWTVILTRGMERYNEQ